MDDSRRNSKIETRVGLEKNTSKFSPETKVSADKIFEPTFNSKNKTQEAVNRNFKKSIF